jgi:uncharacterized membrane protein
VVHFAYPPPLWLAVLCVGVVAGLTYAEYRRPLAPLTSIRRFILAACRAVTFSLLILFLFRPFVFGQPQGSRDAIVPILVDRSRSMRLTDADGQARLAQATSILERQLLPQLSRRFAPETYGIGDRVEAGAVGRLKADATQSDLTGALASVRERYRGQRVAGILLLSDGGNTTSSPGDSAAGGPPVFAIGFGSAAGVRDREVTSITAAEQRLDQATIDVHVAVVSAGFGRSPFQLRLLANGAEIERRRVAPAADGAPIDEAFTVSPDPSNPTLYTADIPAADDESVVENNKRSVLVNPAGRRRRLLVIEGAPGFEHSFIRRAWMRDPGLEVDTVGKKGKNADGQDTFFVQAAEARAAALSRGFPARRQDLYVYDGLVLANVDGDSFTSAQLSMAAEFVSARGGGLLVVGGRSFLPRGFTGTALEEVLPVDPSDRRSGRVAASTEQAVASSNKLLVTPEGEQHPVMRIGQNADETRRLWAALPPLASSVPLGGTRPGGTVLAVAPTSAGTLSPLVAVQQYGRGRSLIFSGEASWRWKMLLPSTDRSFEYFWRQAARWVAGAAPDPVTIVVSDTASEGDVPVVVGVRDALFVPVGDAVVSASVTTPHGEAGSLQWRPTQNGEYAARIPADSPGLYRITVQARRGDTSLGTAERWISVGGVDREFADPRLNEAWMRRVARASGGRYVRAGEAAQVVDWLSETAATDATPERRDLWHEPLAFAAIVALLSAEWILRRRWGLR